MQLKRGRASRARLLSFDFVPEAILSGAMDGVHSQRARDDPFAVIVTFSGASLGIHPGDERFPPNFQVSVALSRMPQLRWQKRLSMFGGAERAAASQCLDSSLLRSMSAPGIAMQAQLLARAWAGLDGMPSLRKLKEELVATSCGDHGGGGGAGDASCIEHARFAWNAAAAGALRLRGSLSSSAAESAHAAKFLLDRIIAEPQHEHDTVGKVEEH